MFTCYHALGNEEQALKIGYRILQEEKIAKEVKEQIKGLVDQLA
ncbi:MAG: hypothetical protein ACRBFS_12690 [Aureispira sp.]